MGIRAPVSDCILGWTRAVVASSGAFDSGIAVTAGPLD